MELLLKRMEFTDVSTIGNLYVDGVWECYTLEDVDRKLEIDPTQKVPGKTAIPRGRYRIVLTLSKRFGRILPELLQVPGYLGVRIHTGNTAQNTEGCPLVGRTKSKDFVGESKLAFAPLLAKIKTAIDKGEEVWIEIS